VAIPRVEHEEVGDGEQAGGEEGGLEQFGSHRRKIKRTLIRHRISAIKSLKQARCGLA
jgi:hypothetical protein